MQINNNRIEFFQVAENKFGELLKSSDMQIDENKNLLIALVNTFVSL